MTTIKIAFRNIFRNTRRSLMTIMAIAVGSVAILLFGGFVYGVELGTQTVVVRTTGHLVVFHNGYFEFGSGNPSAYAIENYDGIIKLIEADQTLAPMITVVTPSIRLFGIAGNFVRERSRTFLGFGVVPSQRARMLQWNEYALDRLPSVTTRLNDADPDAGVIGVGLAQTLDLCRPLKITNCVEPPAPPPSHSPKDESIVALTNLAAVDNGQNSAKAQDPRPQIDLLAATVGGAPNVVSVKVVGTDRQSVHELDDSYVAMSLSRAQQLLFGRSAPRVTAITIQLRRSEDMAAARARLNAIFAARHLPLEIRDFTELEPIYNQVLGMFTAIFGFMSIIIAVIVVFTVTNTMLMSVMERVNEIGTIRALGLRRSGIRRQFLAEGCILGMIGASVGIVAAFIAAFLLNIANLTWVPPNATQPVPLVADFSSDSSLIIPCWLALVVIATIAAFVPANRAAKMQVVDALRHV